MWVEWALISSFVLLTSTCLWRWNRQSVPKRRHINSRRQVITQKKAHNMQNTAKAWNQVDATFYHQPYSGVRIIPHFTQNQNSLTYKLEISKQLHNRHSLFTVLSFMSWCSDPRILRHSRNHLRIFGARRLTCSKGHTENPQAWADLWPPLLSGYFWSVRVDCYTFLCVRWQSVITVMWDIAVVYYLVNNRLVL